MDWLSDDFPKFAATLSWYECRGDDGIARCPNQLAHRHGDRRPSLLFRRGTSGDGSLVFSCRGGCGKETVLKAAGLTWKDVSRNKPQFASPGTQQARTMKTEVETYDYLTREGDPVFQVARYFPKDFRPRRPIPGHPKDWCYTLSAGHVKRVPDPKEPSGGKWVRADAATPDTIHMPAVDAVLYNWPVLAATPLDHPVFWVEGEGKANLLCNNGFVAICTQGGAACRDFPKAWRKDFRGRVVIFLPDNDPAGYDYAFHYQSCVMACGAKAVGCLVLPGLKEKGDVKDWWFATRGRDEAPSHSSPTAKAFRELVKANARMFASTTLTDLYTKNANLKKTAKS